MRQDVNRRLQCHPICCRNNQETIRLSSDHHYFADALLFGIFSSFLSPHPPGNYKEQHKDYCDFVSLHNNWAWNEASVAALTCLISVVLQMQWKCKRDWGKIYFPEFSLWDFNHVSTSSSVFSLIRAVRSIHLQALCMVAMRRLTAATHLHLHLCRRLFLNRWMCCEDTENSLNEHILIINSLAAPLFFQEPWNQNPENTIPALITDFTNALSPLRLLNPPLFFYHFSLLYSFMYSFPMVSVLSERRWSFSVHFRSRRALVPISGEQKSVTDWESFCCSSSLLFNTPISDQTSKRPLYMMLGRIHLNRFKMMNTKGDKIYVSYAEIWDSMVFHWAIPGAATVVLNLWRWNDKMLKSSLIQMF